MATPQQPTDEAITKKLEEINLKDKEPCVLVLGMAGSGKSSFVQVTYSFACQLSYLFMIVIQDSVDMSRWIKSMKE